MSSHNWTTAASAACRRCGALRLGSHDGPYVYSLPDGLGTLGKRPACGKGTESRHSRRAGRRAKVLARSRAGSPRLRTKEALALLARLFATAPASVAQPTAPVAKLRITTAALADAPGGEIFRIEAKDGRLNLITTRVIETATAFTVGAATPPAEESTPDVSTPGAPEAS